MVSVGAVLEFGDFGLVSGVLVVGFLVEGIFLDRGEDLGEDGFFTGLYGLSFHEG